MIDTNKAFLAFKEKLDNMSYEEREQYLKAMGFSFDEDKSKNTHNKITVRRNKKPVSPVNNRPACTYYKKAT